MRIGIVSPNSTPPESESPYAEGSDACKYFVQALASMAASSQGERKVPPHFSQCDLPAGMEIQIVAGDAGTVPRVGQFSKSLKGAVKFIKTFKKNYTKIFRHSFFSPKSKWRCKTF